jgi:uncharacterized membrane protein YcfT
MDAIHSLKRSFELLLFPDLARVPETRRTAAMERARSEPLDIIETAGILAAVVIVTAFTRYGLKDAMLTDRLAAALLNFAIVVPQLVLFAGPFLVRRTRRGLRAYLGR